MITVGAALLLTPVSSPTYSASSLSFPPTRALARKMMRGYFGRVSVRVGLADRATRARSWHAEITIRRSLLEELRPDEEHQLSG